jgi:hypothetical protein
MQAWLLFILSAIPRAPDGATAGPFTKERLDPEDQKLVRDLRWMRPPPPAELLDRYPPADVRWMPVIEKALADRQLAVVGGWFIPLAQEEAPRRRNPTEADYARLEARARVRKMVDCWRTPARDRPPPGTGVDLRIVIAADGKVTDSFFMRFEPRDATVEACVLAVAKQWFFWPAFRATKLRVRLAF